MRIDVGDIGLSYQIIISIMLFLAIARILGLRISTKPWFFKVDMPALFFIFSGLWCQAKGLKIAPENYYLRVQEFQSGDNRSIKNGQIIMIISLLVIFAMPLLNQVYRMI